MLNTYTKNNQVELVPGGKKYFDLLLSLIQNASSSIHLQTYIFADDQTGILVADALKSAAIRGVQVYLLVDGYASKNLSPLFLNQLQTAGIHFRFFEPIFKSSHFYFGRRLHHKVIVIDVKYGLIGGLNVANHYNDLPENPSWLDFAVLVEGEIVQQLCALCWKTWNGFTTNDKALHCTNNLNETQFAIDKQVNIKMIRNDWVRGKNEISKSYLSMFQSSKSS
jgi:cardiolipin synthase